MAVALAANRGFLAALSGPGELVRRFTPNWFAMTMGTGILAVALGQFPLTYRLGEGLWLVNIALFVLFSGLYGLRWVRHFDEARRIFGHASMSMFLGCIPMGLATVINGFVVFGMPLLGDLAVEIATALWWADALLAFACGLGVPFLMFTRQSHTVERMTAVWLLPVVACEVAGASGGLLLPHIVGSGAQLDVLITSYCLWACSVPLAMSIIVILILRMAVHKLPQADMAASNWLALGPIATGALCMLLLGQNGPAVLVANGLEAYAAAIGGASLLAGVLLWGYGVWWAAMAGLITLRYFRGQVPFNLGWWGYIFPLGVFAMATLRLASVFPISMVHGLGVALVLAVSMVWIIVTARTLTGAWRGALFVAPCLAADPQ